MGLTGAIFNHLTFGGICSADYGIYITGEGVFNAPEREVEIVSIPGRNGSMVIDQGRFENISVTYPAGAFGMTPQEFREALSDFRNAILSQKGYQRLEDTYHPDEFRMGLYASGLEVEPAGQNIAGQFELTFNCKPQRWLIPGDLPIPVDSGDVLQNPTVFESSPLLEAEGYGTISFNGFDIELDNSPLGVVTLIHRHLYNSNTAFTREYSFDRAVLNTGDDIYIGRALFTSEWETTGNIIASFSYNVESVSTMTPIVGFINKGTTFSVRLFTPLITLSALAPGASEVEQLVSISVTLTKAGGATDTVYITARIKYGYDWVSYRIETASGTTTRNINNSLSTTNVIGDSSKPVLGNPTYIDCEIGEAYRIENGEYKSCNARISFGAVLPKLDVGSNKITFDNTITDLKIAPRWWKV